MRRFYRNPIDNDMYVFDDTAGYVCKLEKIEIMEDVRRDYKKLYQLGEEKMQSVWGERSRRTTTRKGETVGEEKANCNRPG